MRFFIRTLGCKLNWIDSARVAAALQSVGHVPAGSEAEAELVLVNTCTVTAEAERKSRQEVTAAVRGGRGVAVLGCGPRVRAGAWEEAGRLVFADEQALFAHFGIDPEALSFPPAARTRLFLPIQAGCDNHCTFCITRVARGPHRNIPAAELLARVREAEALGVREVVLTGVNLAAWGADDSNRAEQARLHGLLEELLVHTTIPRIRLSSLGPHYLHDGFFDVFADPRLCDFLHLSQQSGADRVLQRMRRGHDRAALLRVAERARAVRPHTGLAADLIVGFPGEDEAAFAETLELMEQVRPSRLHVFPYSEREGTPAATYPEVVDPAERRRRAAVLRAAGQRLREHFIAGQLGRSLPVLVEAGGSGLTPNYIRVRVPGAERGSLHRVTLDAGNLVER